MTFELTTVCYFSVDRNKYQIHIPLPPKIDPTVTMMQVRPHGASDDHGRSRPR